ncbi:thioredoxin family protein [Pseudomonas sp. MWU16-30317]|uniref:thioredoxin family protein n=1 Tax=Pseudomonas sp. MWU16-30317 TaxID=2878095 RepID=UPI001CFB2F64|nr:thioredoxin family protein [Pseudomonas sp. MWU16-30317]
MQDTYSADQPDRTDVNAHKGPAVIEFGTNWCGHCQAAQPLLKQVFADFPQVHHLKVEDASGRPLGRSFRVKLWPTLIFLQDGQEVSRLVRPTRISDIEEAFEQLTHEA